VIPFAPFHITLHVILEMIVWALPSRVVVLVKPFPHGSSMFRKTALNQVWWYIPIIPALRRIISLEPSLGYTARPCLNNRRLLLFGCWFGYPPNIHDYRAWSATGRWWDFRRWGLVGRPKGTWGNALKRDHGARLSSAFWL
jgi:hypothetical protein